MQMPLLGRAWNQKGTSLVLTAVLLPVLIGLVAVSVDCAVLATARAQLKTVADAAALAGAFQLADENRVRGALDLQPEIRSAQAHAAATGQANLVLGTPAVLLSNPGNSSSGDVVVGYVDPVTHQWTPPPLGNVLLTNSVQVSATRSRDHGGAVPSFFSRALGFHDTSMTVTSTATVQNYTITGYKTTTTNVNLLPIALDLDTYNDMLTDDPTLVTDQFTFDPTTGAVTPGPDGVFESKLYPLSTGSPGNWGTVQIGVSDNSTSTLSSQIQYGITPAQMATFPNGQLSLTGTPPSVTLTGNPGISAGIQAALDSIVGKPVTIPIYDELGGNGGTSWFRVVGFAAARVVSVNFQGNPKYVVVQPALINDPTVIVGTAQTSWTKGGVVRVNLTQ